MVNDSIRLELCWYAAAHTVVKISLAGFKNTGYGVVHKHGADCDSGGDGLLDLLQLVLSPAPYRSMH